MTWGNEGSIWSSSLSAKHQTGGSCLPSPPRVTSKRPADSRCYPDLIIKKLNRENHMECRDLFAFFPWSGVFLLLFILRVLLFLSLLLLLAILLTRILRRSLTSPRAKSGKGTLFSMSSDLEQRLCAIYVLRNLGGSFFLWQFCFWCVYLGEMLSALGKDFLSGVIIFRFQSTYRRSCTDRVTYRLTYFQNLWRKLHELNDTLILPSSKKICRRYPLTSGPSGTRNEELLTQVWEGRWNTRIILNILGITRYLTNTYSSNLDEFVFGRP